MVKNVDLRIVTQCSLYFPCLGLKWTLDEPQAPSAGILHFRAPLSFRIQHLRHVLHSSANTGAITLFWNTIQKHCLLPDHQHPLNIYVLHFSTLTILSPSASLPLQGFQLSAAKGKGEARCCNPPRPPQSEDLLPMTGAHLILSTLAVSVKCAHMLPTCEWQRDPRQVQHSKLYPIRSIKHHPLHRAHVTRYYEEHSFSPQHFMVLQSCSHGL